MEAEAEAFLAHTAYQLKEIAKLSGADRDHAIDLVAAKSAEAELLSLLYNADSARDAKTQATYTKIAEDINARAKAPLTPDQRSDRYGQPLVGQGLRDEAEAAVRRRYKLPVFTKSTVRFGGLRGESALD